MAKKGKSLEKNESLLIAAQNKAIWTMSKLIGWLVDFTAYQTFWGHLTPNLVILIIQLSISAVFCLYTVKISYQFYFKELSQIYKQLISNKLV